MRRSLLKPCGDGEKPKRRKSKGGAKKTKAPEGRGTVATLLYAALASVMGAMGIQDVRVEDAVQKKGGAAHALNDSAHEGVTEEELNARRLDAGSDCPLLCTAGALLAPLPRRLRAALPPGACRRRWGVSFCLVFIVSVVLG